jgi:hypothetical protein
MEQLRNPLYAALVAALITAGYIYVKSLMNNEPVTSNSEYVKPAVLNAIMVYVIVHFGIASREPISTEPF